ncbi:hypothetical protein [Haloplanus salilacus]|uniref:hypothetical protein n=1 Tax=Haloplanus salilacus TaxID=2949994 RepID=UPI0030CC250C
MRSLIERIPWWGYGVVGVLYLVAIGYRLFGGSSLSLPGLVLRLVVAWWLVLVSYLKYYDYV